MRATGMPLGLMPGMRYDEREVMLQPDDTVLFYTDGLVEAHNPQQGHLTLAQHGSCLNGHLGESREQ